MGCDECKYKTATEINLQMHRKSKHKKVELDKDNQVDLDNKLKPTFVFVKAEIELKKQIKSFMSRTEDKWNCLLCGHWTIQPGNLKNHIETHIQGVLHQCNRCDKRFSTSICLSMHRSNKQHYK